MDHDISSVAFPVLGAGIGGFPFDESARIMMDEIRAVDVEHPGRLDTVVMYGYLPEQAEALRRILG
jgi:O-acetyl-ADP-ribose deacetylase (regulator of RNase III)